jgi:hypothetical protein
MSAGEIEMIDINELRRLAQAATPTPQTDQPVPAKNQILRNEWGEPYITDTERKGNNLNSIDTTKYENAVIDTSSWNKTGVQAPSNKI